VHILKIVVDTTVFGQGFSSRSADVRLLKGFLDRTSAQFCVPEIVIDEAANLVKKSVEDVNHKLDSVLRLTGDQAGYPKLNPIEKVSIYRKALEELLKSLSTRILPYPDVDHHGLVLRALVPSKPFVLGGRGYRDALIWFSVLRLAKESKEEICFISANSDDWCQTKKELRLHADLLEDLIKLDIEVSRIRLFLSLGDFTQQYAITTLPISSESTDPELVSPNYLQLLVDGKEWVETILADALPEFLRTSSRVDIAVSELEVLGISAPSNIVSSPIRMLDAERRLLQFSADFRVAMQFLIAKSDLGTWLQHVTFLQRQHWDDARFRVQATMAIKVFFNMIERGEQTEAFSVVSISNIDSPP
jgi:hypothetical protein